MKIKLYIFLLVFFSLIITGIFTFNNNGDKYSDVYFPLQGDEIKIENIHENGLSKEETYATVYKVKKINDINEYKNKLINKLGLSKFKFEEITDEENIYLKNSDYNIQIFKNTGAFIITNNKSDDNVDNMPSEKDAKDIAKKYLDKLGYSEYNIYTITTDERIQVLHNNQEKKEIIAYNVIFNRKLDNKEIYGGDRIEISIGNNGMINKAYFLIRDYEPIKKLKIKSPYSAFKKLKSGKGVVYSNKSSKDVIFEKSEIVYWTNPAPEPQEYVVPVYKFDNIDKNDIDATGFVNALEDENIK